MLYVIRERIEAMYLPDDALGIISLLESEGFSAYVVGGYVRDALLGGPGGDIDICTGADPGRATAIFSQNGYRVIPTGIKHGTVTIMTGKAGYEVTTFRIDGSYSDSRRPDSVRFTGDIAEDLARRDFTVNAMAYSPSRGIIDPFGGREDIKKRLIRAVGYPNARFSEDALRMLRAVRFSARLGFEIEPETRSAIPSLADNLGLVSAERIASELCGILLSERPEALRELYALGLLKHVLPGLESAFESGRAEETLKAVSLLPAELEPRLAALFAGDAESAERELGRLRFSNHIIGRVSELAALAEVRLEPDAAAVKRFLRNLKKISYDEYEAVRRAALLSRGDFGAVQALEMCRAAYDMIVERNEPYLISHLAISGGDIMALGYRGREVGRLLGKCLDYVVENPAGNSAETLTEYARGLAIK